MSKSFIIILFFSLVLHYQCFKPGPTKYNVLLITIDTLRADYLSCYGSPDVKSPNIDRLASNGVLFLKSIAASQCTNPSHSSILTGLYPTIHNVKDNQTPLPDEAVTIAEILKEKGYSTLAAVSAGHLNPNNSNFSQGFDTFLQCEQVELNAKERNKEFLLNLEKIHKRPFFAWVHYFDPHGDYKPPAPFNKMYPILANYKPVPPHSAMDIDKKKKSGLIDPDEIIPLYKGEISFLDEQIGVILKFLKNKNIHKKTLVILVADHGESMTEKGIYFCHAGMYNPVLHVPLIFSMPGKIPTGKRIESQNSGVDIFPTIIDLLGIDCPLKGINGTSLKPTFSNAKIKIHKFIISEAVNGVIRTIYKDGYKFIKPYPEDWACKEKHLFRPWQDYSESEELKHKKPRKVRELAGLLKYWLKKASKKQLAPDKQKKLDKKTEQVLKTLGYID